MGVLRPELIFKSIIPVVMAGILGIYGLIVAIILSSPMTGDLPGSYFANYARLSAGLCSGLSGLAAGLAIGICGDAGKLFITNSYENINTFERNTTIFSIFFVNKFIS